MSLHNQMTSQQKDIIPFNCTIAEVLVFCGMVWYSSELIPIFGEDKRMLYDDVLDEKAKLGILKGINTFLHDI